MQKQIVIVALFLLAITAAAAPAMAARDLGEIADGITDQSNSVGTALVATSAVIGIGCLLLGGLELKKAANRRGDASVAKGLASIIIGFVLVSIVVFAESGSKTIHGDEGAMSERISSFQ
jgi:hypothetical protein